MIRTKQVLLVCGFLMVGSMAGAEVDDFDHYPLGYLPSPWMIGVTGGGSSRWTVESEPSAPSGAQVLKQSAPGTFPWAVRKDSALENGFVEVKFKAVAGGRDQAGGVIWRFKDGDNYYVARANALEDNVNIYHTINGKRRPIKSLTAKVSANQWHILRVEFNDQTFRVIFDDKEFVVTDATISGAGAVGLWTKADSVTLFDDFYFGSFK